MRRPERQRKEYRTWQQCENRCIAAGSRLSYTLQDGQKGNPGLGDSGAGAVNVIYGGPAGLAAPGNQIWHQDSDGIVGGAESFDRFGEALAAGDFNNDGFKDLAIGVPRARIFNLMFYIPTFQRPSASLFIGARAR